MPQTADPAVTSPAAGPTVSPPAGARPGQKPAADASRPFADRHLGPDEPQLAEMLKTLGLGSLDELADQAVPGSIRLREPMGLGEPQSETEALQRLREIARQNRVYRSMIGCGYHGTITPPPILRSILENPLWYTPYTPYQSEIAQGRLEALLNFQTMVGDLTGLPLAGASLLDEATAAAEAMAMCHAIAPRGRTAFFAADHCHPQTLAVLATRAESVGLELRTGPIEQADLSAGDLCGVLVQYPATDGRIEDFEPLAKRVHEAGALLVVAADILALTLLRPPGEFGADIAVGSTQRFGVPMGFGGPHAGYLATRDKHARKMPGRLVGVSRDADGRVAYRLAIQTREQHIRRDKATSNICTAQVLLAVIASMYAVYHGPEGLARIARQVHRRTAALADGLTRLGCRVRHDRFFDTLAVEPTDGDAQAALARALDRKINLRRLDDAAVGITLDQTTTDADLDALLGVFAPGDPPHRFDVAALIEAAQPGYAAPHARASVYLTHPVFHEHQSEHELLRYITRLQRRDISLADSMIPLGSCTMKLNAAAEMLPITWPEFAELHPFAPADQARGYRQLADELCDSLARITGFAAVSLQPNAGSQGEYAGLLTIRAYHRARGEAQRDVCLIPTSAHGTNPASATIAGLRVVPVACRDNGDIDLDNLRAKADEHADRLAALMITYPSTHGVFETTVTEACTIVHEHGGQVYLDGANMNAQVGLCRPGDYGADVCHLNLHKTFCIPHGGGGPGVGPIGVAAHLAPFLPGHPASPSAAGNPAAQALAAAPALAVGGAQAIGPVAAAPLGSASILPISWMYLAMMGETGLRRASRVAIAAANYMAHRLKDHYDVLFTGPHGRVAHEFIIDCRGFEKQAGVRVEDIAKRLIDFGFHAPTMSWPVPGTMMIEPTESESLPELDRFCEALIHIRREIAAIASGDADAQDNPLRHAPHTAEAVTADRWDHAYTRQAAAYPVPWVRQHKYWPPVGRVDNVLGDRQLVCSCPPVEAFDEAD